MMEDELDRDWVEGFSGLKEDWQVIEKVLPPDASEWYQVSKEVNKAGHFNHPV
jgi:hypothetical protein